MANIPPDLLDVLSEPLTEVYKHIEDELLINIAKRFNTDKGLETNKWHIKKLAEIGQLTQDNIKIIAANTGQVPELTQIALESTLWETLSGLEPEFLEAVKQGYTAPASYPPQASPAIRQALENYGKQAINQMNLVNTVMLEGSLKAYRKAIVNTVTEANYAVAQGIMNKATGMVITGVESRQTALTKAIKQMADEGITAFYDKSGRAWSPEAYINMDIRTTMGNTATATVFARMDDYQTPLLSVSSHAGARPLCAIDQGRLFSIAGGSGETTDGAGNKIRYDPWFTSSYGKPAGILGINCHHYISPFFPGLSYKRSEPTKNFEENERIYKESQKQRGIERSIRSAKREAQMQKVAGNQEAFEKASIKVKRQQDRYKEFCETTGRTPRPDRTQVVGYDRKTAASVTQANKNYIKRQQEKIETMKSSGIIKIPTTSKPNDVIDTVSSKGTVSNRTIYDEVGNMIKQINPTNHGNAKKHPFGQNGEHAHDIIWEDGKIVGRPPRELADSERKEHSDIL